MATNAKDVKQEQILKGIERFVLLMSKKTETEHQNMLTGVKFLCNLYMLLMVSLTISMAVLTATDGHLISISILSIIFFFVFMKSKKETKNFKIMEMYVQESNVLRKSAKFEESDEDEFYQMIRSHMRKCILKMEDKKKDMLSKLVD